MINITKTNLGLKNPEEEVQKLLNQYLLPANLIESTYAEGIWENQQQVAAYLTLYIDSNQHPLVWKNKGGYKESNPNVRSVNTILMGNRFHRVEILYVWKQ